MPTGRKPRIIILSGDRGLGKTSAAIRIAALLRERGIEVGGVVSPSERRADGLPMEIFAKDLGSGETRRLGSRTIDLGGPLLGPSRPHSGNAPVEGRDLGQGRFDAENESVPPFSFSREAVHWAGAAFQAAMASKARLLLLDEIGPLELELDSGFRPLLEAIAEALERGQCSFVVTVRPSLAGKLAARFPAGTATIVELTAENRDGLAEKIAERLSSL